MNPDRDRSNVRWIHRNVNREESRFEGNSPVEMRVRIVSCERYFWGGRIPCIKLNPPLRIAVLAVKGGHHVVTESEMTHTVMSRAICFGAGEPTTVPTGAPLNSNHVNVRRGCAALIQDRAAD